MPRHPAPPLAAPRARAWAGLWIAAIVLAGFGVYFPSLGGPFLFDDIPAVVENESIRDLGQPARVLHPPAQGAGIDSRPVINLSLALNYAVGGLNPHGYRLANVAIHVLAALALFGLVRRTLALPGLPERLPAVALPVAGATALLWTLHPLQTETVICVIQRTEAIVSLWYLLALYCFSRAISAERNRGWLPAVWISCLLGMASKEVMVSAPLILLLYDRSFAAGSFREAWRRRGRWHIAFAATWLLLAWLVLDSGGGRGGTAGFGQGVSSWTYLLTQARALAIYLKLSIWPSPLIVDYGDWLAPGLGAVLGEAALVVALLGLTLWALVRRPRIGFVGALFFAVLAPSSSFYPLVSQTIAEHRMYLPLAAVLVLAVTGLFLLSRRFALGTCVALVVVAGILTVRRGADYASEQRLWADVVAKNPGSAWAHFNLGKLSYRQGRLADAERENRAAVALNPGHADAHFALGLILERQGRPEESLTSYARVLELRPAYAEAHFRRGLILLRLGRADQAQPHFAEVVRLQPDRADAAGNLGAALYQLGRLEEAVACFERVLALEPESAEANYNLGLLLLQLRRGAEALPPLEKAARLRPQDIEIQRNLEAARAVQSAAAPNATRAVGSDGKARP
jgi:protein O-mannosyl-transferase